MTRMNYHQDLSADDQALAELSGIAAGWVQNWPEEGTCAYRVGCEICGFFIQDVVTLKWLDNVKVMDPEGFVEERVWEKFKRSEQGKYCPHISKYRFWKKKQDAGDSGVLLLGALKFIHQHREWLK